MLHFQSLGVEYDALSLEWFLIQMIVSFSGESAGVGSNNHVYVVSDYDIVLHTGFLLKKVIPSQFCMKFWS